MCKKALVTRTGRWLEGVPMGESELQQARDLVSYCCYTYLLHQGAGRTKVHNALCCACSKDQRPCSGTKASAS